MEAQMRRPYGHEEAEDPFRIHDPGTEEEEHHEKGASKVLKKVKEKARKIKTSLTKHGNDHDVEEEDDEYEEQEPEVHGAPVYESSAVRGGVTGIPESLSHAGDTNVPAPEEIVPPGTKVFPVVSSDYTEPTEPVPSQDKYYGHEALSDPVRRTAISDREESREAHHEGLNTPVSLLSATEDVTRTFAPGEDDRYLGGQRKVNIETPKRLEEDPAAPGGGSDYLSGVSNYQSKVADPTIQGSGEAGVPEIAESLGRMKVTDESSDQKSRQELAKEVDYLLLNKWIPCVEFELEEKREAGGSTPGNYDRWSTWKLPSFGCTDSGQVLKEVEECKKKYPNAFIRILGFDNNRQVECISYIAGCTDSAQVLKEVQESQKEYPNAFIRILGFDNRREEQSTSYIAYKPDETDSPTRRHEFGMKDKSGRDLPTGTHDQFSPELSRPKEIGDSGDRRDEASKEKKPSYTEQFVSATSAITNNAIAAKNAVASKLGYSGESGSKKNESSSVVEDETPRSATGYGQKVAGTVAEKLTPVYEKVKETGSTVMKKLPLSGGVLGVVEEKERGEEKSGSSSSARDYLSEKMRPGEEDKALSEMIAEKLHLGGGEKKATKTKEVEVTVEKIPTEQIVEEKANTEVVTGEQGNTGGGMVGKVKGTISSWLGGTKEGVKPKSPDSVEESPQSLGTTVGTKGFPDSGDK